MSHHRNKRPYQAQQRQHTAPTGIKEAMWKMSQQQARRLRLPEQSENWESEE